MKNERQEKILEILKENKFAEVTALSRALYASLPTIRRDLTALERQGLIRRSHGGAALTTGSDRWLPFGFRSGSRPAVKAELCGLAAEYLHDGDTVFLDESSTCQHLADCLGGFSGLTVVTNSLIQANLLTKNHVPFFCTGGELCADSLSFLGRRAEEFLEDFCADIVFFSAYALTAEGDIADYNGASTALRRVMLRRAKRRVFLCDSEKLDRRAAFRVCGLDEVDVMVSDRPLPPTLANRCAEQRTFTDQKEETDHDGNLYAATAAADRRAEGGAADAGRGGADPVPCR